jgi:pyruvate,water dikinase
LWFIERQGSFVVSHPQTSGGRLDGVAASSGVYTGPVRVLRSEADFDRLRPGDVLVCPITSPAWSVLFPNVGALVADEGGVLSHSAIIAREFQIPAVVATGNATSLLRDGQRVTVDGTAGVVTVLG